MKHLTKGLIRGTIALAATTFMGCGKQPTDIRIQSGDTVTYIYTSFYADDSVADSGTNTITVTTQTGFLGLMSGETKLITFTPDTGTNAYKISNLQRLPREAILISNPNPQIGESVSIGSMHGIIRAVQGEGTATKVLIDTNPRNTRDTQTQRITIVSIER